jgi:hypothetical protein
VARDSLPGVTLIGVLLNPKIPAAEPALRDVEAAAKTVGVRNAVGVKNFGFVILSPLNLLLG